ncbi:Galactose-binding-like protein [Gracilaria domingensis]|nr:Galactose-binding-like protein [Gracilaria domingensis]
MSQARRSERLRRKRLSTPGLSRPGNYSLYGTGYVVESEASFLPPEERRPSKESRRVRYKDSPHKFVADSPAEPPPSRRVSAARGVADRVRVSLFDILGSAAKKPASTTWRSGPDQHQEDEIIDHDEDEPQQQQQQQQQQRPSHPEIDDAPSTTNNTFTPLQIRRTIRNLLHSNQKSLPIVFITALFITGMVFLLFMEARYSARTGATPAYARLRDSCTPRWTLSDIPVPPLLRALTSVLYDAVRTIITSLFSFLRNLPSYLFRSASRAPPTVIGDFVTRTELEQEILPRVITEAKKAAQQDAARLTADLPLAVRREAARMRDEFSGFAERYAADKDLPPDFALASAGGRVLWTRPSMQRLYGRFVRQYAEALFGDGIPTPHRPVRASTILEPDVLPGRCWSFEGDKAEVMIRLLALVKVNSVTMEHTPRASVLSIRSAPRQFKVYGVRMDGEEVEAGDFVFDMEEEQKGHLQRFYVPGNNVFRAVRVEILGNHGANHTSLYRFRVHGEQV